MQVEVNSSQANSAHLYPIFLEFFYFLKLVFQIPIFKSVENISIYSVYIHLAEHRESKVNYVYEKTKDGCTSSKALIANLIASLSPAMASSV